jgi:hypothetical protein
MKVVFSMVINQSRVLLDEYVRQVKNIIECPLYRKSFKEDPEDFTRKRIMTFPMMIQFILTRRKGSTQNELENFFDKLGEDTYMTQQAFSNARNKIKSSAFSHLFYNTVNIAYQGYYETYKGYRVLAIDGSKFALPDVFTLRQIYGAMGPNLSSPTAQASICYDILNKVIVDALIKPLKADERALAIEHIINLEITRRFEKELVIADRGYPSFDFVNDLYDKRIDFLMRVKSGFNNDIDSQETNDGYVFLKKNGRPDVKVRVIKFMLPSGEEEMLITSLFQKNMGIEAFKKLYFLRWPVETKFDEVKNKLEIENFTGYSQKVIEQDFYATMYLSNIAAAAWWEAQAIVESERAGKDNEYAYAVNVNHEIGVLKDRFIYALSLDDPAQEVEKIIRLLAKRVTPIKPDRSFKRNKSPRKSKFHFNTRSNC